MFTVYGYRQMETPPSKSRAIGSRLIKASARGLMRTGQFSLIGFLMVVLSLQVIAQTKILKSPVLGPITVPSTITDKETYLPGDHVLIGSVNYLPLERVSIEIGKIERTTNSVFTIEYIDATAGVDGSVSGEWKIWDADSGGSEYLVRTAGLYSGRTSKTVFSTKERLVPTPVVIAGNPSCGTLNADDTTFPHITHDWGLRIDDDFPNGTFPIENNPGLSAVLTGGAPADPGNSITVSVPPAGDEVTSWSATRGITAVIIRRGPDAIVYPYNPASMGPDGPLPTNSANGIWHVEFCFQPIPTAKITIYKHATPPSAQQFDFTASPGLTPANFTLVDSSIGTDPSQVFTVTDFNVKTITEVSMGSYTLRSINCVVDIGTGGTPTPTQTGNSINIDIKPGDEVSCEFNNDLLTAATVSVSGRVYDRNGRGLPRAVISVTDLSGNRQTARTNPFGYYTVRELEAGGNFIFEVRHKSYVFAPQFMNVNDSIKGIDFVPQ